MVETIYPFLDDPFGCTEDLRDALTDPDLEKVGNDGQTGPDGARAAYRLALTLGRCRLFGVDPGEEFDGVLPSRLALAAASELTRLLLSQSDEAANLGERWDRAVDPSEADNLCAGLLSTRMEAWAVGLALDEAQEDCEEEERSHASALADAIDRVQDALDRFDVPLEAQTEVLATIANTRLLDNWRALLAAPYKDDLPWWLDGRLEEAACCTEEEAVRTLPGPTAWAEVRNRTRTARENGQGWSWLHEPRLMAAAEAGSSPFVAHRDWRSPDGVYTATLAAGPDAADSIRVNFYREGEPAPELAGEPAFLAGVPSTIDTAGNADFSLVALRHARDIGRPLSLVVGAGGTEWLPLFKEEAS